MKPRSRTSLLVHFMLLRGFLVILSHYILSIVLKTSFALVVKIKNAGKIVNFKSKLHS